jgi:hypothetical protein
MSIKGMRNAAIILAVERPMLELRIEEMAQK